MSGNLARHFGSCSGDLWRSLAPPPADLHWPLADLDGMTASRGTMGPVPAEPNHTIVAARDSRESAEWGGCEAVTVRAQV